MSKETKEIVEWSLNDWQVVYFQPLARPNLQTWTRLIKERVIRHIKGLIQGTQSAKSNTRYIWLPNSYTIYSA